MPRHDDLHAHFSSALHHAVEVVHFEPQQYAVSIRLVVRIADRAVMVSYFEPVQLKDKFAIRDQLLIFGTSMIAPAAQQTLVPSATRFHIGYGDERLRTHGKLTQHKRGSLTTRRHGASWARTTSRFVDAGISPAAPGGVLTSI
jgi:hypothetical protein